MFQALILLGLSISGAASGLQLPPHGCLDVTFNVAATSQNTVFSSPPDPNNSMAIIAFAVDVLRGNLPATSGTATVSSTFAITGTYCVLRVLKRKDTLEILVYGITYNKTMWAGMGFSDQYNWHKHANAQGYATLALDRLGYSLSSYPDPLNVV